jgi:hypothetical protein
MPQYQIIGWDRITDEPFQEELKMKFNGIIKNKKDAINTAVSIVDDELLGGAFVIYRTGMKVIAKIVREEKFFTEIIEY